MEDNERLEWRQHHIFESDWWGDCTNTFGEETKQLTYAHRMGLVNIPQAGHWPVYDMAGKNVIDIGGGPSSILLKCINLRQGLIIDPLPIPQWAIIRYESKNIDYIKLPAEDIKFSGKYDEIWIYNVLQHTMDPEYIVGRATKMAFFLRIFEWIDMEPTIGHPHTLTEDKLNEWIGQSGQTEILNGENGCEGRAYYGSFKLFKG